MTVTDIRTTKRGLKSIYLDGEFAFTLYPDAAAQFGFFKGVEAGRELIEAALAKNRELEATQKALRLLSARSYTSGKLMKKLSAHGNDAAQAVITRMEELHLVDDEDYAHRYAKQLYNAKHMAPRRIRHALTERGVPKDIADEVSQEFDADLNAGHAAEYIGKKYPDLSDTRIKSRAAASLRRLGYTTGEIIEAFGIAGCREEDY